uniref:RNA polymerase sigma factor n=2 Tax=Kalanchoe fedtschenkoi TaxID=63787 RepID=A0A7N0T0C4_KALFE
MSCLLPQFKCPLDLRCFPFRPHHHQLCAANFFDAAKGRVSITLRAKCVLSPTASTATVLKPENLRFPSFKDRSSSSIVDRPWTYNGGTGPPPVEKSEQTIATEAFVTTKETDVVAAAAEAVALAKAALAVAKAAALMAGASNSTSTSENKHPNSSSESDSIQLTRAQLIQIEQESLLKDILSDESVTEFEEESDQLEPEKEELELLQTQLSESVAVRSKRQTERKARRAKAAEKASASVLSVKSGSTSKKKRTSVQEVDYNDLLRYLRSTTSTSRLLTASEELQLSAGIQDLLKLEAIQNELTERLGVKPTLTQWAAAAGIDQKTLRERVNYGTLCKDKMIKSNIRLVISIAKNYQGVGMNLQDLVQEGCRGLVRGAEKFDASKGFKFSTYAHWWIKQAVRKSLSDQSRTIRLPFHMVEATYRVKEARKQLQAEKGRVPTNEEIAEATGLSMKKLMSVLQAPKHPRSLDQKMGLNMNMKPSEVIADPEAETSDELLMKQMMREDLNKVLDTLNSRERLVVRWRFGLEDGRMKTLQEIGELMNVSRERIRQIESCAFRKLKNKKRTKNLQQYVAQ